MLNQNLTQEQMLAMIAELQQKNAALQAEQSQVARNGIKVSQKGAISLYGLARFPITLYVTQWETLFSRIEEVKQFIESNRSNPLVKLEKDAKA